MSYRYYKRVYRTTIVDELKGKAIYDSTSVEIFQGSRTYKTSYQSNRIIRNGVSQIVGSGVEIVLPGDGTYIEITIRTKELDITKSLEECRTKADVAASLLAMEYSSDIFNNLVIDGWIIDDNKPFISGWIKRVNPVTVSIEDIEDLSVVDESADIHQDDNETRFELMSKFRAKALLLDPSEEQLLFLWSALEVFPMKNTSDIKPISEYLSKVTGINSSDIKTKLKIGRLFGHRSDLVHDGKLSLTNIELAELTELLEVIVNVIMRGLRGLPYDGSLDDYLR